MVGKYSLSLVLLVMYNTYALGMNLVEVDKEKCQRIGRFLAISAGAKEKKVREKYNAWLEQVNLKDPNMQYVLQCKEVATKAINFIEQIPQIKCSDLSTEMSVLDEEVAEEVNVLAQRNVLVAFTLNKDMFTCLCSCLPESYEDCGGFFYPNHKGVVFLKDSSTEVEKQELIVSKTKMMEQLAEMQVFRAFSVFWYMTKESIEALLHDYNVVRDYEWSTESKQRMRYLFTFEERMGMTEEQLKLFSDIVDGSNDSNEHFTIMDKHIPLLQPCTSVILGNELLENIQIKVDIPSRSPFEKAKDTLLIMIPFMTGIILPDMIHSQMNSLLQRVARLHEYGIIKESITGCCGHMVGLLVSGIVDSMIGGYIYRIFDSYHSDVGKLSQWFGRNNHTRTRKGLKYLGFGMFNYSCAVMMQNFFAMPWETAGIAVSSLRLLVLQYIVMKLDRDRDPFKRSNKAGVPFMLKDLVNGPKFNHNGALE